MIFYPWVRYVPVCCQRIKAPEDTCFDALQGEVMQTCFIGSLTDQKLAFPIISIYIIVFGKKEVNLNYTVKWVSPVTQQYLTHGPRLDSTINSKQNHQFSFDRGLLFIAEDDLEV